MPTNPYQPPGTEKRRWPQFSLRTLLIAVAVVAMGVWALRFFEKPPIGNLTAVKLGMTQKQVHEIIGYPMKLNGGSYTWTETYRWPRYGTAEVRYIGGRVDAVDVIAIE